jgi:hypothetical protein
MLASENERQQLGSVTTKHASLASQRSRGLRMVPPSRSRGKGIGIRTPGERRSEFKFFGWRHLLPPFDDPGFLREVLDFRHSRWVSSDAVNNLGFVVGAVPVSTR